MFGIQPRDVVDDFNLRRRRWSLWTTPPASMPTTSHNIRYKVPRKGHANAFHLSVKFEDLCGFMVEGNVDDVNVLNEVRERIREQGRVWWALEASKGANWYLQPRISSNSGEGMIRVTSLKLSVMTNTVTLKRLIRKGVPPALRPKVWLSVSGAAKKRSTVPETYYDELIRATEGKTTPATRQIDLDLPRTFPCHPWLNSEAGQASLRRVLVGYSFRDSEVGYCQGLNYVAALLLLVMKTEEDAFWMLAVLLENVLVGDCYTDTLTGCHVEQRVFKDLLAKNCPRIAAHLEAMGFDVSLVATEWFLCLFSKTLPSETTLRVWDVLFNEGAKVLFHVALAIFKMREDDLLRIQHIGDVIDVLQTTAHHLYEPDELLTLVKMTAGLQLGVIGSLALSVASSVAIVICNKALISTLGFPFATTLTSWHLMVTYCTLHVAQRLHFFEPKAIDGHTVILFGFLNGTSIGLLNLSLGFNSIGFYQMTKLAIIPFTVLLETIFLNKRFSETIKLSLMVLLLGVGIASITDLKLNLLGSVLSGLAIATTCVGQILTNTIQRKLKVSSTQLLYQSAPYQAAILFATGPFVDQLLTNRSVFAHKYTTPVVGFIVLSCLIAVSVNFSTFLVIGTTSPVTYQVLGHLKTCLVLSFGYTLLHDPFTMRNIFGMGLYSFFSVRESKKKSANDALPISQMQDKETEPLLVTKDSSDPKKANGVSHGC